MQSRPPHYTSAQILERASPGPKNDRLHQEQTSGQRHPNLLHCDPFALHPSVGNPWLMYPPIGVKRVA